MKSPKTVALAALCGLALALPAYALSKAAADKPKLSHFVVFNTKEKTKEAADKLVEAANKYLTNHEGAEAYYVGTRAVDVEEGPSVKDFEVTLQVIFTTRDGRDKYLKSPRHDDFVAAIKGIVEKARVFDSYLVTP